MDSEGDNSDSRHRRRESVVSVFQCDGHLPPPPSSYSLTNLLSLSIINRKVERETMPLMRSSSRRRVAPRLPRLFLAIYPNEPS